MDRVDQRVAHGFSALVRWLEIGLAGLVLLGVLAAAVSSVRELLGLDWSQAATFDRLMSRVLFIAIGLELARMLVVHSLRAILEMLAFAIARNMLLPDRTAVDIVLGAVGFAVLLAAARYFLAAGERSRPAAAPVSEAPER
ncbi:MAG TPA: hypothetical protein VFQ51_09470 [Vicinamibacteria bacterium]|nr:hypothetical protein [Vicinamibacteria bacterium]